MLFKNRVSKPSYISFMRCVIISALLLPICALVAAIVANALKDPTSSIGILSLGSILLSAAISGAVCTRTCGADGVKISALTALFITLIMMLMGFISGGGKLPFGALMNYVCYLLTFTFCAVVFRKREGTSRRRKHR